MFHIATHRPRGGTDIIMHMGALFSSKALLMEGQHLNSQVKGAEFVTIPYPIIGKASSMQEMI